MTQNNSLRIKESTTPYIVSTAYHVSPCFISCFTSHKVGKQFYSRQKIHYSLNRKIDYPIRRERFSARRQIDDAILLGYLLKENTVEN